MDHNMFCFQCEQTAGCTGCTSRGVCAGRADCAGAGPADRTLIGPARRNQSRRGSGTWQLMIEGLFATLTNVNFDPTA
ncbi:MAG: hypothetical protein ACLTG4_11205 [Oscillospiraceae bacterium]